MQAVSRDDFLGWAAGVGVGFDPRYPDSGCLSLLPPTDHARFWVLPANPAAWPHFAASVLGGLDAWTVGYVWPRSGRWPDSTFSRSVNEGVEDVVLRGAGVPDAWRGAVQFGQDETPALVAVLYIYLAFGGCVDDDLFFVPDHGRQVVWTDHHDVIHVRCASEERVMKLVADMAKAGYELPTELPDETFIRPAWMAGTRDANGEPTQR